MFVVQCDRIARVCVDYNYRTSSSDEFGIVLPMPIQKAAFFSMGISFFVSHNG